MSYELSFNLNKKLTLEQIHQIVKYLSRTYGITMLNEYPEYEKVIRCKVTGFNPISVELFRVAEKELGFEIIENT